MDAVVVAWYGWLSSVSQAGVMTLQRWADAIPVPLVTAMVLGAISRASGARCVSRRPSCSSSRVSTTR
jgi:hypothetical protein